MLRIAHINTSAARPKKKSADDLRRYERLSSFRLRDWKRVEAEYADELKEIREIIPNWKPNF